MDRVIVAWQADAGYPGEATRLCDGKRDGARRINSSCSTSVSWCLPYAAWLVHIWADQAAGAPRMWSLSDVQYALSSSFTKIVFMYMFN